MDRALNRLANLLIAATCLCMVGFLAFKTLPKPVPASPVGYRPGDQVPEAREVRYGDAPRTMLVFFSSRCRHCVDGARALADVVAAAKAAGVPAFGLTAEPLEDGKAFTSSHQVGFSKVLAYAAGDFDVHATPVVLVVDRHGILIQRYVGSADGGRARGDRCARRLGSLKGGSHMLKRYGRLALSLLFAGMAAILVSQAGASAETCTEQCDRAFNMNASRDATFPD